MYERRALPAVACLAALSCGGGATATTRIADASGDSATLPVPPDAASPDATGDAAPFVSIAPCQGAASYVDGVAFVDTGAVAYLPPCLRVKAGSFVTIEASVAHPLEPRPGGSPANPIPAQITRATVSFPTPGFYPYQCPEHVDQGMLGVVWVTEP